jgi:RNA polymerase sigma-70 factor (ECF subfamily)
MPADDSFADLLARLRRGQDRAGAEAELFRRFQHRLIALAGSRLDAQLRGKVDPESVVQSVFASFFLRQRGGQFVLHDWGGLWGLLATITLRKCGHRVEHFHAACRDVRREQAPLPDADDSGASWEALAREPSPQEAACLTETVEGLMQGLDERQQRMLALSLQGHTPAEISAEVGRSERRVYVLLQRVRQKLEALRDDG